MEGPSGRSGKERRRLPRGDPHGPGRGAGRARRPPLCPPAGEVPVQQRRLLGAERGRLPDRPRGRVRRRPRRDRAAAERGVRHPVRRAAGDDGRWRGSEGSHVQRRAHRVSRSRDCGRSRRGPDLRYRRREGLRGAAPARLPAAQELPGIPPLVDPRRRERVDEPPGRAGALAGAGPGVGRTGGGGGVRPGGGRRRNRVGPRRRGQPAAGGTVPGRRGRSQPGPRRQVEVVRSREGVPARLDGAARRRRPLTRNLQHGRSAIAVRTDNRPDRAARPSVARRLAGRLRQPAVPRRLRRGAGAQAGTG